MVTRLPEWLVPRRELPEEPDSLLPRLGPDDAAALAAERAELRNKLEVFGLPGWAQIAAEAKAKREADYKALARPELDDMARVSLIRGEIAAIEQWLSEPRRTRERIAYIDEQLETYEQEGEDV